MVGKYATETILADAEGIARAAQILRDGGLVAVPTETVYGLAARADSDEAVARIYEAKGRPSFNPLIVHVHSVEQAARLAVIDQTARALMDRYWPGPLTLVLPRLPEAQIAAAVSAGLDTVALRMPDHPVMQALLSELDLPIAAPSANRSGFISPTNPDHVRASLDGRINAVIQAGACAAGVESTIVAVRADGAIDVLRPGPLDLGGPSLGHGIEAPGQLASHYAPGKPVRLNATEVAPDDFMIGFGAIGGDCSLSEGGDLNEAASRLYACLHEGARSEKARIAVAPIPETGIGIAINDRLRRAATPAD
ncbi:L-threonylcarbamoyladenylate synthase [Qipengyuania sp. RANM35]|uniref:L-threonylcarbamoyladenylate synthase n=1 Tax=Qipengyuania sp. RANM35 TaxID=3068635 RepID=UPI0034DAED4C